LREIGIQPDILLCRIDEEMSVSMKKKLSLFTSVEEEAVISAIDIKHSIYEVPVAYDERGLSKVILKKLHLPDKKSSLAIWEKLVNNIKNPKHHSNIAIVGKYIELQDSYKSIYEALHHGGIENHAKLNLIKINSENINKHNVHEILKDADGILVPGGFGERGIEGKIIAACFARENKIPYFGICLGMQIMVIEFGRNILDFKDANSTEFDGQTPFPVISLLEEQEGVNAKGGTMRLGANNSKLFTNTIIHNAYKKSIISERHRHRYEFNNLYRKDYINKGLIISGVTEDDKLVETVEWSKHPFGIGVQFHPEFKSKPFNAHPLFREFIKASLKK
jgi:CTP synthase